MFPCNSSNCDCESFKPGNSNARVCDNCHHAWIQHAIVGSVHVGSDFLDMSGSEVDREDGVSTSEIYQLTSLILFGSQAIPIRLKILLDRLFASLGPQEYQKILNAYSWTQDDFAKGYILQDRCGRLLKRWFLCTKEEETVLLQQFLRFPETRDLAAEFLAQELSHSSSQGTSNSTEMDSERSASDNGSLKELLSRPFISGLTNSVARVDGNFSKEEMRDLEYYESNGVDRFRRFESQSNPPESRQPSPYFENPPERLCRSAIVTPEPKDSDEFRRSVSPERTGSASLVITEAEDSNEPRDLTVDRPVATVNPVGGTPNLENSSFSPPSMFPSPLQNLYFSKTIRNHQSTKRSPNGGSPGIFGSTLSGSSGKKRVMCEECLKTFCDKGALKIHFSAVHLREMHQCIVPGCTMMFSSRRSRNRHSANPNPKLHTSSPRKSTLPAPGYRVVSPPEAAQQYERTILEELNRKSSDSGTGSPSDFMPENVNGISGENRSRKRKGQPIKLPSSMNFGEAKEEPAKLEKSEFSDEDLPLDFSTKKQKAEQNFDQQSAIKQLDELTRNIAGMKNYGQTGNMNHSDSGNLAHKFWVRSLIAPQGEKCLSPNVNCFVTPQKEPSTLESRSPTPKGASVSPTASQLSSGLSGDQNSQISFTKTKTPAGTVSIPINEDNPRQCTQCGKMFQNHFSVKTHFQNVHLKLMHKCTVPGCNAAFPSKRSRDRHSANQNLHRKLLSGPRDGAAALQGSLVSHMAHHHQKDHMPQPTRQEPPQGVGVGDTSSSSATQTQVNGLGVGKKEGTPSPGNGPQSQIGNNGQIHQAPFRSQDFFPPLYGYPSSFLPFAAPGIMSQLAMRMQQMAAATPVSPFFSPQTLAANLAAAASVQAARKTSVCDFSPGNCGRTSSAASNHTEIEPERAE